MCNFVKKRILWSLIIDKRNTQPAATDKMLKPKNPKMIRKHAFKKGAPSANPLGRGAAVPITREIRKYTTQVVADIYNKLSDMSRRQLRSITIDPEAPALEVIVAKALLRDMRNSAMDKTETVLSRIIGHVPVKQEFGGMGGIPLVPPTIVIQDAIAPGSGQVPLTAIPPNAA